MNITEEQIEAARQKRLQDEAALQALEEDPADPANICIGCE